MASLRELRSLSTDTLRNKVESALIIEAHVLLTGTPSAAEITWSARVLAGPKSEAEKALRFVLAANASATVAQIEGASDTTIQTNVAAVVPHLVAAG